MSAAMTATYRAPIRNIVNVMRATRPWSAGKRERVLMSSTWDKAFVTEELTHLGEGGIGGRKN